jgi:hypothetical protein
MLLLIVKEALRHGPKVPPNPFRPSRHALRVSRGRKSSVFNNPERKIKPHFDRNHCVTVLWEDEDLIAGRRKLTATIRATLPSGRKWEIDSDRREKL